MRAAGSLAESDLARRLDCPEDQVGQRLAALAESDPDLAYIDGFGLCAEPFIDRVRVLLDEATARNQRAEAEGEPAIIDGERVGVVENLARRPRIVLERRDRHAALLEPEQGQQLGRGATAKLDDMAWGDLAHQTGDQPQRVFASGLAERGHALQRRDLEAGGGFRGTVQSLDRNAHRVIMRHVISVLLQNEVGALTRMTGLFASRGYNIDSLNVAPTDNPAVSRVTLVIEGSDAAIAQLNTQLAKLVDVVNIHDMTLGEHFERELAIVKLKLATGGYAKVLKLASDFGAEILDDSQNSCTIQLTGRLADIDAFVKRAAGIGTLSAVARSGSVAVSKGEVILSSYTRVHRLTG